MRTSFTTKGLVLGKLEAEAEADHMLQLYEDYMGIEDALSHGKFILTGRKGSGKSAYGVWLNEKAKKNEDLYCHIIKHNDQLLEQAFRSSSNLTINNVTLFEWLILYNLTILIISSQIGRYGKYSQKLHEFARENPKLMDGGVYTLEEITQNSGFKLNCFQSLSVEIPLLKSKKLYRADFLTMLCCLKPIVIGALKQECYQDKRFYVMFDDLDVKFKLSREEDRTKLVDLIRTARDYNTMHLQETTSRIILLLRDDIASNLADSECDTNKIFGSYEHRMDWYQHSSEEYPLQSFINKRIELAFRKNGIQFIGGNIWEKFVTPTIDGKDSFKYILDNTFYLPRDIITIFNNVGSKNWVMPLTKKEIDLLLREYVTPKYTEIKNELAVIWDRTKITKAFNLLSDMFDQICRNEDISYEDLSELTEENGLEEHDINTLIEYSLIVPKDKISGKLFINYRESQLKHKMSRYCYGLHKVLMLYFNS